LETTTTYDGYKVQLDNFEGPLDLLLYLIKKDEVDIYEISIERITSQYLEYLETFIELNVELASEFAVMAANLMYIKSRSLLPKPKAEPDDSVENEDPKWELIKQLIEYKKFKDAALHLEEQEQGQHKIFPARPSKSASPIPDLGFNQQKLDLSVFDLINAFQRCVKRFKDAHSIGEIVDDKFTVSEKITWLLDHLQNHQRVKFDDLFDQQTSKTELIVTFLAVLELLKANQCLLHQNEVLGEIEIELATDAPPLYESEELEDINHEQ